MMGATPLAPDDESMRRRAFLSGGVAAALGSGLTLSTRSEATAQSRDPTDTLLPGTEHETPVFTVEGERDGPTALVVGGMHGDERSGYLAAEAMLEWSVDAGRVVVLPRANRVAIQRDSREGEGGDLNRQFPPGAEPPTELARAIWSLVERESPDDETLQGEIYETARRHDVDVGAFFTAGYRLFLDAEEGPRAAGRARRSERGSL